MRILILVMVTLLLLPACGSTQPQQAAPPEQQQEETQAEPAQETTEEEPAEAPQPAISREDAMKKWGAPFLSSAFASTVCKRIIEKPDDPPLGVTIAIGLSAEFIKDWKPTPDQAEIDKSLRDNIKALGNTYTDKTGEPDLVSSVEGICPQFETLMNDMRVGAQSDGLTDEDFQSMIEEMQKKLEEQ